MAEALLELIETTAADPSISDDVRDWLLEKAIPALCGEVRRLRKESRPVDLVGGLLATAPPAPAGTVARKIYGSDATPGSPLTLLATIPNQERRGDKKKPGLPKREKTGGKQPGPKVPGLRAAMKRAGMLAPELAARLGVSEGAVDNWGAGRTGVQPHRMQTLTSVLGCSEADLTGAK